MNNTFENQFYLWITEENKPFPLLEYEKILYPTCYKCEEKLTKEHKCI